MRVVVAVLFCVLMVGLGYPYVARSRLSSLLQSNAEASLLS